MSMLHVSVNIAIEADSDVESVSDLPAGTAVPGVFRIVYVDAAFARSERVIEQCRHVELPSRNYVLAHCRLRDGERLFRLDRVAEVADHDTGEILSSLGGLHIGGRSAIESRDIHVSFESVRAELDVLVFVATLSAGMRDSQISLIVDYLEQHGGVRRGTAGTAKRIAKHQAPNPVMFRQRIKDVPPTRARALRAAAAAVLAKTRRNGDLDRGVLGALDRWLGLVAPTS